MVKRGRPLQIAHKQVHVAHPAARRHPRPALAARGAKQIRHVERVRRHHEFSVLLPPGALRTVGVDLDPQPVRIAEVHRLAHQVVGHPGTLADLGQVPHEAAELRPVRQQDGEMVQAQPAAARHRRNPGALAQLDQRFPTLVRPERHAGFVYRDSLWHGADLVGTGVASFGHFQGVHYQNVDTWEQYIEKIERGELPLNRALPITDHQRLIREMILQLKTGQIDAAYFRNKFGEDIRHEFAPQFSSLVAEGFAQIDGDKIFLNRAGLLRVDALLHRFFEPEFQNVRYT